MAKIGPLWPVFVIGLATRNMLGFPDEAGSAHPMYGLAFARQLLLLSGAIGCVYV
jgi:hypothetical protein